jgi:hypothetical protein
MTDALLKALRIHPAMFRALLKSYLLMDFRSQHYGRATGVKPHEAFTPLFWVVSQCLFAGTAISVILFLRVELYAFTFAALAMSMVVMLATIVVEFNEVVLDPSEIDLIGHHPVLPRTYASARLANLCVYVLLMTAALNVFPALAGLGFREAAWSFPIVYAVAALIGNFLVTGALIVVYAIALRRGPGTNARDMLAWVQILLIMVLVYGGQMVFRDGQARLEMFAYTLPAWIDWTPPGALARSVDGLSEGLWARPAVLIGVCAIVAALLWAGALRFLAQVHGSMSRARTRRRPPVTEAKAEEAYGRLVRSLTRPGPERLSFWLCCTMLWRDGELRMRSWVHFGAPLAVFAMGWYTRQLTDPFVTGGAGAILPITCLLLPAMSMPALLHNLRFSRDHAASWVLATAPGARPAEFGEGMRKAIQWAFLAPTMLVLSIGLGVLWRDPAHAAMHFLICWLLTVTAGYVATRGVVQWLPFSAPLARGESMGSIAAISAAIGGGVMLGATGYYYATASKQTLLIFAGAVMIAWLFAQRLRVRETARKAAAA